MTDKTKYMIAIKIPGFIIGTICTVAMLPVTTTIIAAIFIWNSLKRCNMPEDQIRMVKNMYWGRLTKASYQSLRSCYNGSVNKIKG